MRDVSRGQGRAGTRTGGATRVDNVAVDRVERVRRWSENEVTLERILLWYGGMLRRATKRPF